MTQNAPEDPIFGLLQAHLDRLWTAWMRATGKKAPPGGDPYRDAASMDGLAPPMPAQADSHPVRASQPARRAAGAVLQRVMCPPCAGVTLSFCRIDATGSTPSGGVFAIGEVRLELTTVVDV